MKLRCQVTSSKSVSSSRTALGAQAAGTCRLRISARLRAGPSPKLRRFHLHSGSKSTGQKLKLTCNSVNTSNGNGNGNGTSSNGSSAFKTTSDAMETPDMGGSDPNVIKELQQADQNPFPERHFDVKSDDPLENLKNQVQLSCYGDAVGGNLKALKSFLDNKVSGAISGVHLLPIYPSSGDGGFAPLTYQDVDPKFGTWDDVKALGAEYDLQMECMVNHISPASKEFQDYLAKGDKSEFRDMFIDWNKLWGGEPTDDQLQKIRTRKPEAPVIEVDMKDGSKKKLWCTFGAQQIDIDPFSKPGMKFMLDSLRSLGTRGSKLIRLDAFGYATKTPGTRCFFQEPEVWGLLKGLEKAAKEHDTGLLCEVHEEYETNIKLAKEGYFVYDFALPLLLLHAFTFHTAENIANWLRICPRRQITVLDTHDGMGIDDISGLASVVSVEELSDVVEHRLGCSPNFKYFYDPETKAYQGRPHQYNCTYYSALGGNARHYLLARAIQFFTPGIPMVYYVGLFAGLNDYDAVLATGSGRDINRHKYTNEEAEAALHQPVVKALLDLCKFRNTHEAFMGQVDVVDGAEPHLLEVTWQKDHHKATLKADLQGMSFEIIATKGKKQDDMKTIQYVLGSVDCSEAQQSGAADMAETVKWEQQEVCHPVH